MATPSSSFPVFFHGPSEHPLLSMVDDLSRGQHSANCGAVRSIWIGNLGSQSDACAGEDSLQNEDWNRLLVVDVRPWLSKSHKERQPQL